MRGTIRRILGDRGFGFIEPDDGSEEVFFHRPRVASRVQFDELREGGEVEFRVYLGAKGQQACEVRLR